MVQANCDLISIVSVYHINMLSKCFVVASKLRWNYVLDCNKIIQQNKDKAKTAKKLDKAGGAGV